MGRTSRQLLIGGLLIIGSGVATLAWCLASRASGTNSAWQGLPLDDGWIHLTYARHLATHFELAYNPGEAEAGFTSPLWIVLLSPLMAFKPSAPAVMAKLLSGLCALALFLLGAATTRRFGSGLAGLAAGLALALDPPLTFSSASAMEVCLAGALVLATLLALLQRRAIWAGLWWGLAVLSRPECAALATVLLPWAWYLLRRRELPWRSALLGLALALALQLPFVAYCLAVTGRPLTNTFYVKGALGQTNWAGLWVFLRGVAAPSTLVTWGVGLVAIIPGMARLFRRGPDGWATLALPWAFVAAVIASRTWDVAEATTYYFTRYFHPALPLLAIPFGLGLAELWSTGRKRKGRRTLVALVLGGTMLGGALQLPATTALFSWNTHNIEEMQVATGRWLAAHTPQDAVIAASDAGAVRFFGGRRTIDLMGLNYHPGVEARREGRIPLGQVMANERPSYLAIIPQWFPQIAGSRHCPVVFRTQAEHYTVAAAPQGEFVVCQVRQRR
jgi:hypothetical protein